MGEGRGEKRLFGGVYGETAPISTFWRANFYGETKAVFGSLALGLI